MSDTKATCEKCGVSILQMTADRNAGLCQPCSEGRKVNRKRSRVEVKPGRRLDRMCIPIEKYAETQNHVDYFYCSSVWDKDPRFESRSIMIGENRGLLRITKEDGQIQVLYPMFEDDDGRVLERAIHVLSKHWKAGEYPAKTMFASG